ncbi:aminotransferase class V-fold PLP-dependent enzyme [bacterium]|nr:MAG: aminotransferase class V-fold PLP-dependent enzyme [bacterium]
MRREAFYVPDDGLIYLDGNSLGRLPVEAIPRMREVVEAEWGGRLIRGWNEGWLDLPSRIANGLGSVLGVPARDVAVCDSTSVNLYKLAFAAVEARRPRNKIVTEPGNFPSDLYVLQGLQRVWPDLRIVPSTGDPAEDLDEDTALLCLSHADYRTGRLRDLTRINEAAHRVGALTLWDASHSAGACPILGEANGVDLLVGCGYKHLNGGPGAPAFLYVAQELQDSLVSPIQGWFGQSEPFGFQPNYRPARGIDRFMAGTPPILALAALEMGVALCAETGIESIRARSLAQTDAFIEWFDEVGESYGLRLDSPRSHRERGAHILFGHPEAWRINLALIEAGVIGDFRTPDGLRLGPAPLYTTDEEIEHALRTLEGILKSQDWQRFDPVRARVT